MRLIEKWSDQQRQDYASKVLITRHFMNETGLFTDEALAKMLDKHPTHLVDFQHIPDDAEYKDQQVTVDFTGAGGHAMLEAAKSDTRIWINVREVMNTHPEYKEVLDQLHHELEEMTGKNKDRRNSRGGILISSKTACTPYHADPTMTHLWHLRGHKKMWVYPDGQKFIPDEAYEAILLGEIGEDMPYDPSMDNDALVAADLTGGEFISWPHRAPHRVENVTYCVSMTMEFSTRKSAFVNAGMFANGVLRRKYGANPVWAETPVPMKLGKVALGRTMRHMGVSKSFERTDIVRFKLDTRAPELVVPVDTPYERRH